MEVLLKRPDRDPEVEVEAPENHDRKVLVKFLTAQEVAVINREKADHALVPKVDPIDREVAVMCLGKADPDPRARADLEAALDLQEVAAIDQKAEVNQEKANHVQEAAHEAILVPLEAAVALNHEVPGRVDPGPEAKGLDLYFQQIYFYFNKISSYS